VHLRSTLAPVKWDGDWAIGKPTWKTEIKKAISENYLNGDEELKGDPTKTESLK
jgi:hypothetical protein